MNICTVTTLRRVPFAVVLAESFLEHHPQGSVTALVSDAQPPRMGKVSNVRWLTPADLGLAQKDIARMAMTWPEPLLKRAFVPELLRLLIEESSGRVFYFSDDSFFLGRSDDLFPSDDETGLILALKTAEPLPSDGRTPEQGDLLEAGILHESFAGVAPSGKHCLDYWSGAIRDSATHDSTTVPKRVQDLLAAHFPHHLLSEPLRTASFWNAWSGPVTENSTELNIAGTPLGFFHFNGFDPEQPHLLSPAQGPRPRVLLSERPDLLSLTGMYRERLISSGFTEAARLPYGFERLPSGIKVDDRMRRVYRQQARRSAEGEGPPPPDPFDPSSDFVDWLRCPDEGSVAPSVSRYLYALYEERGDLRAAFPGIARADVGRYLDWVLEYGAAEAQIPAELCPPPAVRPSPGVEGSPAPPAAPEGPGHDTHDDQRPVAFGANIVGYFKAELGVGEMGRLVWAAVEQAQLPYATTCYSAFLSRQTHPYEPVGVEFSFDTNLFCVNADQLPSVVRDYGPSILESRYNIGLWWWEVDVLPPKMAQSAAAYLDEIWVGSENVAKAVAEATDKVVGVFPVPIRPIEAAPIDRSSLGLPEGFMFLFSFDFLSVFDRKNPVAVVDAFKRAFGPGEGPFLLIKTINGSGHLQDLEKLRLSAHGRPDIKILDGYLSAHDKDRLVASADCYVSLHRAEGYGLGMAEAMSLGKPIIATRYSGNLAFLNESNSYLIDFELVPIPAPAGPYPPGAHWAEPDVEQAADVMKKVWTHPEEARKLGLKAMQDAQEIHTLRRTADFIARRLSDVHRLDPNAEAAAPYRRAPRPLAAVHPALRNALTSGIRNKLGFKKPR